MFSIVQEERSYTLLKLPSGCDEGASDDHRSLACSLSMPEKQAKASGLMHRPLFFIPAQLPAYFVAPILCFLRTAVDALPACHVIARFD
jgi:hypothetical protein